MKKILTLSIALILIAGIVSLAESADIDTSNSSQATADVIDRHIVQSSNGTVVVLYQGSTSPVGIRAKKSTDKGATWTDLSGGAGSSTQISSSTSVGYSVCIDTSDHIYVAYLYSYDVYFKKLTYNGDSTWTVGSERTVDLENDNEYPSIVRDSNGNIWVAYPHNTASGAQIVATRSTDTFQTSGTRTDVSSPQAGSTETDYSVAMTMRNGNPFIVFQDNYDGAKMKWSYWNGSSWSTPQQILTITSTRAYFSLTSVGATVHLVVEKFSGEIVYTYYDGTWHTEETLISGDLDEKPSLTTNDVDLWCYADIYYADPNSSYRKYNIKYKKRTGSTWDADWTAITTDNRRNQDPSSPSISKAYVPLAWTDATSPSPYTVKFDSSVAVPDSTSPAAITDLTGLCNSGTGNVTLSWSTPGDNGWNDTLPEGSGYRIDYSTYSKQWNKDDYELWIPTSGVAPHTKVSRVITGLTGDTTWYFQIWTRDEIPNWSGLSNGATVWVNPILSVSISTDTYNFGEFSASTTVVSTANITVTNDGNVKETYSIKCSSSTKWTPDSTPGSNKFTLQAAFHPSQPNNDDITWKTDDILTESLQQCTTAAFSIDNSESGKNVLPFSSNMRNFWLRLKTPLGTSTTVQQVIPVTISAEQGSP